MPKPAVECRLSRAVPRTQAMQKCSSHVSQTPQVPLRSFLAVAIAKVRLVEGNGLVWSNFIVGNYDAHQCRVLGSLSQDVSSCARSVFVANTSGLISSAATCLLNTRKSFEVWKLSRNRQPRPSCGKFHQHMTVHHVHPAITAAKQAARDSPQDVASFGFGALVI